MTSLEQRKRTSFSKTSYKMQELAKDTRRLIWSKMVEWSTEWLRWRPLTRYKGKIKMLSEATSCSQSTLKRLTTKYISTMISSSK